MEEKEDPPPSGSGVYQLSRDLDFYETTQPKEEEDESKDE